MLELELVGLLSVYCDRMGYHGACMGHDMPVRQHYKLSFALKVATTHHCDMTERLQKATSNTKPTNQPMANKSAVGKDEMRSEVQALMDDWSPRFKCKA